jgi:hypothetical protein
MTRKIMRRVSWPIVFVGLAAPFITNCGALKGMPGVPSLPGGNCPDMAKIEEIDKFDFAANFKLSADVGAKIKAGVGAAVEMKALAAKVDADLVTACGGLAKDLGDTGTYTDGQSACKAAMAVMGTVKAKFGASASIALDITPPQCGVSVDAYADCAGSCDVTAKGPSAEVTCEGGSMQGGCSAQCSGDCEMSAAAACSGTCSGSCDASISGSCDAKCDGKCDGKATPAGGGGQCAGKCEGKCSGNVKGTCSGKCGGSCHMSAAASCSGTCTGGCSVKMTAPKCTGTVKPPKLSADCKAKCDAKVQANASCTPPHISLRIPGSADAAAAATFQAAIEKNLPVVLDVAIGMGKQVAAIAASVKTVAEGGIAAVQTATSDKMAGVALIACVTSPFKGAIDAAASVQANVNVSVNVQASASASGSAKAGG